MNTKSRNTFRLQPAKLIGAAGFSAALSFSAYASATPTPGAYALPLSDSDDISQASAFWANTASNLNLSVDTTLYGFAMTALGLNGGSSDDSGELAYELGLINADLINIENQLSQIDADLKAENCNLDSASISTYVTHIVNVEQLYKGYMTTGATPKEMQDWLHDVFDPNGDAGNSISENLTGIKTGLMPQGLNGTGVIGSCLAVIAPPTSGQLDDTAYYSVVQGLMNYYFGVQTEGMMIEAEAYNLEAFESWKLDNPNASITPEQASSICDNATGSTLIYCKQANQAAQEVYDAVQLEFSYAGAPYSTSQYKILNGTNYLYALSLEDFTAASGENCSSPLTVNYHCGPTQVSSPLVAAMTGFDVNGAPMKYGYYTGWKPMSTSVMGALFNQWTDSNETLADYLSGLGFQNTANKIILTPQTSQISFVDGGNQYLTYHIGTGACFADTSFSQSHGSQPFCSNLANLVNPMPYSNGGCWYIGPASWVPQGSSDDDFYQFTWETGGQSNQYESCTTTYKGNPPGYMVSPAAPESNSVQSVWPYFDISALKCTDNEDGSTRSNTNPSGVPTMCGADFDKWFGNIVTAPPALPESVEGAPAPGSHHKIPKAVTY